MYPNHHHPLHQHRFIRLRRPHTHTPIRLRRSLKPVTHVCSYRHRIKLTCMVFLASLRQPPHPARTPLHQHLRIVLFPNVITHNLSRGSLRPLSPQNSTSCPTHTSFRQVRRWLHVPYTKGARLHPQYKHLLGAYLHRWPRFKPTLKHRRRRVSSDSNRGSSRKLHPPLLRIHAVLCPRRKASPVW